MKKLFILSMVLTQLVGALEWKAVKTHPVPPMTKILFYDSKYEEIEIGIPEIYKAILWDVYELEVNVTHWIDLDDLPKLPN